MTREELLAQLKTRATTRSQAQLVDEVVAKLSDDLIAKIDERTLTVIKSSVDAFPTSPTTAKDMAADIETFVSNSASTTAAKEAVKENPAAATATQAQQDTMTEIEALKAKVDNGKATQAEKDRYLELQKQDPNSFAAIVAGSSSGAVHTQLAKLMAQQFGDGSDSAINATKQAIAIKFGMTTDGISDALLTTMLQTQPSWAAVATEVSKKRTSYTTSSSITYGDPSYAPDSSKKVTVTQSLDKSYRDNIPGFDTYGRLAASTLFDSQDRFNGQNIYGLWAMTEGYFDPNKDWGSLGPTGATSDMSEIRKSFIREQLIAAGKLPPRYIDGELNPVYDPTKQKNKLPSPGKGFELPGTAANVYQQMWDDPEALVDAAWWKDHTNAWIDYSASALTAQSSEERMNDDVLRKFIYDTEKPKFDAALASYGEGNELAAIVSMHNKDLADKMVVDPASMTASDWTKVYDVFGGLDPSSIGIARDAISKYRQSASDSGPKITIVQPDRTKISEGFRQLYQQLFMADPTPDELNALVENVAGQYVSAQYARRDFDTGAAMTEATRGTDLYSQLYGAKPTGLSEADYIGQFQRAGSALLGGAAPSAAAVQAGMRANDVNLTGQVTVANQSTWQNSSWLENFYKAMQTINSMT